MKRNSSFASVLAALVTGTVILSSCGSAEQEEKATAGTPPPTVDMKDFFKNPEKSSFNISPDGQYISYLAPWKGRMNIVVQKVGSPETVQVTKDTIRDIGGYFWKGDRILYSRDINGDENFIVFSASIDGTDVKALTPEKGVVAGILDDLDNVPGMEQSVMVQMNDRDARVFDPYLINVVTGARKAMYDNSKDNYESWITDHNGVIRMATKTDGVNTTIFYRASDKEPFAPYMTTGFKDFWAPEMFTFDNTNLIVNHNLNGRDKTAIVEWDLAGKKEIRVIAENADYDMGGVSYSKKRKVLTMATWTGAKSERLFLDKETEAMYGKLAPKFEGLDYWVYGEDDSETKFLVWAGNDRDPGTFYSYDLTMDKLEKLASPRPWIDPSQMAAMEPITYTSRDGLTIHGYLTLPAGREAKNLPLVVNPHGGPWARDQWGFNPEVQLLANRGYAVLQMNFRGSTGYGRKFWEASFKQWGKTMQDDITDGVDYLVKSGKVDPKRVAIYGASYGGYATLAGITYTPDLYAAAVDYVGVSDLFTFQRSIPPYWAPFKAMMFEMVGDPVADSLLLDAASPARHADKIKTPLFIAQGANDPRVVKAESDQMVAALKGHGVEVEYMVKDNEGHGFHNEENRFDFYGAMEKFLDKYIGSGYTPAAGK
ncbi:MAG TPA: S9 family peptidase [Flavobacteriales bacterium]|nr:S9 family peptidase [Flavobacteriales bacterium]